MPELITAVHDYAGWLYALIALLLVRELRTVFRASREQDVALFSVERDAARGKSVRSMVMLLLLVTIGLGTYTVARFGYPMLSERERRWVEGDAIAEPPRHVEVPADTPVPTASRRPPRIVTAAPTALATAVAESPAILCRNPNVDILAPGAGSILAASTEVVIVARFDPAEGKSAVVDWGAGGAPAEWLPLAPALTSPADRAVVAVVPPAGSPSGTYSIRLRLVDAAGGWDEGDSCVVAVRVP